MKTAVLMIGVHASTKGGMRTVADNYLNHAGLREAVCLTYLPFARAGGKLRRLAFSSAAFVKLLGILLFRRVDLVHIHSASRGSFLRKSLALRMAKAFRKPVVFHLHGAGFEAYYEKSSAARKAYIRATLRKADRIVCLGQSWERFFKKTVGAGERISVLYNAVAAPEKNPYRTDSADIVFLGELGRRKGVYDLLAAVKRSRGAFPDGVRVLLYGNGEVEKVRSAIEDFGLAGFVFLCGYLEKREKESMFASAMINVLPSYHEGLPMTILEMMAHGVPSITTDAGAIPEAVEHGKSGLIVAPGDTAALAAALAYLVNDPEKRLSMSGEAYRCAASKFSIDRHVGELLQIYESLRRGSEGARKKRKVSE
ncbi:MAG: glycosyltransferase family 4 protein [Clostridiales Family XIII bacterium]|jgi:glycosyltransferase involved in cell wall biosynthesis|nr:glycosyltransferase family 4 protein [Clostridiales Family XIII bacterium]